MPEQPPSKRAPRRIALLAAVGAAALAAIVIAVVALASGGSSGGAEDTPAAAAQSALQQGGDGLRGALLDPSRPAPALALRSSTGQRVDLAADRGKAVLVTFLYTNCPDVCPLTAERLRQSLNRLGAKASDVRVIAVSVDPRGDTRAAVARFLRAHRMTGRMQYLIGTPTQLQPVWKRWGVLAASDQTNPDLVNHSALVYGIDGSGRITTIYPSNLRPADVAHDVPVLASPVSALPRRVERLRALGCQVRLTDGPPAGCTVTGRDGATIGRGEGEAAMATAVAAAERTLGLDPIDEASDESFPASDPPELGGPGL